MAVGDYVSGIYRHSYLQPQFSISYGPVRHRVTGRIVDGKGDPIPDCVVWFGQIGGKTDAAGYFDFHTFVYLYEGQGRDGTLRGSLDLQGHDRIVAKVKSRHGTHWEFEDIVVSRTGGVETEGKPE